MLDISIKETTSNTDADIFQLLKQKLEFKLKYYNSFPNSGQNPIYHTLSLELERKFLKDGQKETKTEGKREMFVFRVLRSLTSCNVRTMPS